MNRFYPAAGQFWLNDQPILIQAGEFHYFRTPQDQWRHRLNILKEAGFNTLATYIPWIWHQLEEDVSDFDGHSHPMRNLEGFLDLAAEMGFFIIPRPGPYIMAETINEGIPPWVFKKYPQAAYINQYNVAQNIASYLQADFLRCVKKWYREIFQVLSPRQVTRGGRIIMIQLDNEMGMMQWVRNIIDTNPDTMTRFAGYLKSVYGDDLQHRYEVDNIEHFLSNGILNPKESEAEIIVEDYKRFYRQYLKEYTLFLCAEAKANGMDVLPVINIHGFANGGKTFPIGLSQLIEVINLEGMISATDVYPSHISEGNFHQLLLVNEMTKAVQNKGQPLFSMEFQAGGHNDFSAGQSSFFDLHTRLCISSGMRAINHYLFFGGENDPILSPMKRHDWGPPVRPDGTLRKHFFRYPKLSKALQAYGTDLVLSRPQVVTTIGFMLDHFMTEVNNKYTQGTTDIITHQRDVILFDMIARGLALTHRPFEAVELTSAALDSSQTPTLWVMMDKQCNADTQQKLVDYIRQGGKLILVGRMCVEDFNHRECLLLKHALGIKEIHGGQPFVEHCISAFEYAEVPATFVETYAGEFDEVFARSENGDTVGFLQNVGNGKIIMFGAALTADTLGDINIVHEMAMKMDCPPQFKLSDWADVRVSRGAKGSFLFISNYQDDPIETTVEYENKLLFSGIPLYLPARRGFILPLEWQINRDVLLHYATTEVMEIKDEGSSITLQMAQDEFFAEMTLSGYHAEHSGTIRKAKAKDRIRLHGKRGVIVLRRDETMGAVAREEASSVPV